MDTAAPALHLPLDPLLNSALRNEDDAGTGTCVFLMLASIHICFLYF